MNTAFQVWIKYSKACICGYAINTLRNIKTNTWNEQIERNDVEIQNDG
jgi:hypothetical protein